MKRFFVFILILALSAATVAGSAFTLFDAQDDVEIREEYVGDRAAANGLTVDCSFFLTSVDRGWNTAVTVADGRLEPRSVFGFSTNYNYDDFFRNYSELELWSVDYIAQNVTSEADIRVWASARYGLTKHAMDVAGRTNPGETRAEVVNLSDYYGIWPWVISGHRGYWSANLSDGDCKKLSGIFTFHTPKDAMAEVVVTKDSSGKIASVASHPTGSWHEPVTVAPDYDAAPGDQSFIAVGASAINDDGAYLYPAVIDCDTGENLLEYRDGPGIYFIPSYQSSGMYNQRGDLIIDGARLIYKTDERPLYLRFSSDEKTLQFYSVKDGTAFVTVLDPATGKELYRSELMKSDGSEVGFCLAKEDMFLIMDSAGNLALLREENSVAKPVFKTRLDLETEYPELISLGNLLSKPGDTFDFAFDGQRLAICEGLNMYVLTADETGLTYYAQYNYSPVWNGLTGNNYYGSAQTAYPYVRPPMTVSFD